MRIDLPLGSSVVDPIALVEEDLTSIGHSYHLAVELIQDIYDGLRPYGVLIDTGRTEASLVIRPKDVYGTKAWTSAFDFDVVLGQNQMYSRFCHVSAIARRFMTGWEVNVSAGEKGDYRNDRKNGVAEKSFGKVVLNLIRKVDRQGKRLQPLKKAS